MRGAQSNLLTPIVADIMCALQDPPLPMVSIPQADHHVLLDQPLAFVASLRAILALQPLRASTTQ